MDIQEVDEDLGYLEEPKNSSPEQSKNQSSRRSTPTSVIEIDDEIFLDAEQYELR